MDATFSLWGLGGAALTGLILAGIKKVWLGADGKSVIKDRWAVLAAVIVGMALSALASLGQEFAGVQTVRDIIGAGLLAGLAACGLYSGAKKR